MKRSIFQIPLFAERDIGPPIPDNAAECSNLLGIPPETIANRMIHSTKLWIRRNPGKDWRCIVPPGWQDYIAWQLGKDKGKEHGYFEGYKKGFSDAKFLSKMEHERQHQLETMINKHTFIKCEVCLKRHGKHKTIKQ